MLSVPISLRIKLVDGANLNEPPHCGPEYRATIACMEQFAYMQI